MEECIESNENIENEEMEESEEEKEHEESEEKMSVKTRIWYADCLMENV